VIELSKIRIDGGTQPRAELNQETVAEYRDAYKAGAKFPPVTLYFDGSAYWLADGFHRFAGAKDAGLTTIHEDITPGTLREAILYSLSANSKHGLRRSNADKRRAVQTLLSDAEWSKWPQSKLAEVCGVTREFVSRVSTDFLSCDRSHDSAPQTITVTRNGTTYEQKKRAPEWREPAPEERLAPAEPPEPEYTPLDAAHDQISDLQDALARASVGELSAEEKEEAAGLIARLREENRLLRASLKAVTASRDHYQAENGELKHQIRLQRREIDKLAGTKTA
jgi:hypothetical protein